MSAGRGAGQLIVAGAALAVATGLAWSRVEPFRGWYYQLAWYPTLLAVDGALARREGKPPLLGQPRFAVSLFLWSIPAWLLFELINFRLANWYYVLLPDHRLLRWGGAAAAFATVLPALYLAYLWMERLDLAEGWRRPCFEVRPVHRRLLFALGCLFVLLAGWKPDAFFPLLWGSMTLLLEPFNHRWAPERSLLGDLARGSYTRPVRLLAAGAAVGLVWELFNSLAGSRWIYTVPGLEDWKLFEMPLPGFLGFPVFALDCFVFYQSLVRLGVAQPGWHRPTEPLEGALPRPVRRRASPSGRRRLASPAHRSLAATTAAAAASLLVLAGIDRWTVDSVRAPLEAVSGVDAAAGKALKAAGIRRLEQLAEADSAGLVDRVGLEAGAVGEMLEEARLAALRGIGALNASALRRAGIRSVCELARADPQEISRAIRRVRADPHAGRSARVRVWLRAARRSCGKEAHAPGSPARGRAGTRGRRASTRLAPPGCRVGSKDGSSRCTERSQETIA